MLLADPWTAAKLKNTRTQANRTNRPIGRNHDRLSTGFPECRSDPLFRPVKPIALRLFLLFLALIGDRFHHFPDFLGIAQEIIVHQVQVVVEFEHIRNSGRQI